MLRILEIKVKIEIFNSAKTYKIIYNLLEMKVTFKFVRSQVGLVGVPPKLMISRSRGLTMSMSSWHVAKLLNSLATKESSGHIFPLLCWLLWQYGF